MAWGRWHGVFEMALGEEEGPPGLTRVQSFRLMGILKVLTIGEDYKRVVSPLEPLPPFL